MINTRRVQVDAIQCFVVDASHLNTGFRVRQSKRVRTSHDNIFGIVLSDNTTVRCFSQCINVVCRKCPEFVV